MEKWWSVFVSLLLLFIIWVFLQVCVSKMYWVRHFVRYFWTLIIFVYNLIEEVNLLVCSNRCRRSPFCQFLCVFFFLRKGSSICQLRRRRRRRRSRIRLWWREHKLFSLIFFHCLLFIFTATVICFLFYFSSFVFANLRRGSQRKNEREIERISKRY